MQIYAYVFVCVYVHVHAVCVCGHACACLCAHMYAYQYVHPHMCVSLVPPNLLFLLQISFLLGLALFPDDPLLRLGLFLNGSCPGGGASNMWTHLLGGSLDLSIMMTFISTITAFGETREGGKDGKDGKDSARDRDRGL